MAELIPSYLQKIARAERHLADLTAEVDRYRNSNVYRVRETVEGKRKRKVRRLEFTVFPENTDIGIVAADLVYNLRSGLDHLAARLASKKRDSVMFPIFWSGVWGPRVEGENDQRKKDRERWATSTRNMRPEAVTIIKSLQPRDGVADESPTFFNAFSLINQLSNTDRHSKLPIVAAGLEGIVGDYTMPDGNRHPFIAPETSTGLFALEDGAEIQGVPYRAVHLNLLGTPAVTVRVGKTEANVKIPDALAQAILAVRERAIDPLVPYISPG
jgi:hypothetical protein